MDAIEQRRNKLEVIIKSAILSDDKLLAGLAIHALGDSYAHTKFQGVGTYPCGIGHGTRSIWGSDSDVQPDQIRKRPELHREYMERLTKIMVDARMRKDHVRSDEKLNEKLANLKRFTDEMYDKLANARSDADEIEALSEGVSGNFYSYTYSESNYTKTPFRPENFDPKYPPGTGKTGSYPLTIPTHGQMEKVLAEIQKQIPLVDGVIQGLPNASITNEY